MSPEQLTGRTNSILEKEFIKSVLQRSATRIKSRQEQILSISKLSHSRVLAGSKITTPNHTIHIEHLKQQRFIDMRRVSSKNNKHQVQIHNKVLMAEFNRVMNELSFGYSEAVKEQIANDLKIEL